ETMGDYLLWELRLDPPVYPFCYTHVHLFTFDHWRECMFIKNAERGWQDILDREGIEFIVIEADQHSRLAGQVKAASDRWQVVTAEPILVAKRKWPEGRS